MNEKLSEVNTNIKDMDAKTAPVVSEMSSIGTVVGGLDRKYHLISQNLRYQLAGMIALILIGLTCCLLLALK
jgi:tetrahydromethanopterin S-methyltransferase subunit F